MEKNNLDNLFKEKFKDFAETPDEKVWENIEASLNKKRKKRVVPIWWQLGGAAAALALLFYFINPFDEGKPSAAPTIVDTQEKTGTSPEHGITNEDDAIKILQESQEQGIVGSETGTSSPNQGGTLEEKQSKQNNPQNNDQNFGVTLQNNPSASAEALASNNAENEGNKLIPQDSDKGNILTDLPSLQDAEVVANDQEPKTLKGNPTFTDSIAKAAKENEVALAENQEEEGKKSIYDAIQEQKDLEKEVAVGKKPDNRWAMGPSVAPVFFGSVGEGSPIHSNFASNSKSGNLNLSYGLTVTYNINDKLSVRSGVHRVDYGYDTNDVVFTSSLTTSTNQLIDNINYAQTSRNLVVESKSNEVASFSDNASVGGAAQPFEGRMVQQLGYVEVPMELNYALLDKKFGVNLIGGFSSLFLVDNAVSLESNQLITEMGEANNANDISFSTNIGVGFNYEISQKLQFNVEPIFKYQLNTFSETAGNFRPYAIGVYSGLNFRF